MAQHQTKIIAKKQVADHQFAVLIECCGDPGTQSWHTLCFDKSTTLNQVNAWLADRHQHVQDGHATTLAIEAHISTILVESPNPVNPAAPGLPDNHADLEAKRAARQSKPAGQ